MITNARLIELAERRATLIARAATQRNDLAQATSPLRTIFSAIDQGIAIASYLRQRPILLAGAIAALILIRPGFFLKWLKRGWLAWRFSLAIKRTLSGLQKAP